MKRTYRIFKPASILILDFILGFALGIGAMASQIPLVPANVGGTFTQDPALVTTAQQLGIDASNVNLSYADVVTADDVSPEYADRIEGSFLAPNTITIKSGLTESEQQYIVAYEFMHYFWQNLPQENRDQLTTLYQTYYDTNESFQTLTAPYTGEPSTIADERNSNACTRVEPSALTDDFNAYCDQYIKNRSLLF